jgi:hypothetical protein
VVVYYFNSFNLFSIARLFPVKLRTPLKNMNTPRIIGRLLLSAALCGFATVAQAAVISQSVNNVDWNTAMWGTSPALAPTSGNDYITIVGLTGSTPSTIGAFSNTASVRDNNGTTFGGHSITLVSGVELLLKQAGGQTSSANIIMSGGSIRHATGNGATATIAGTMQIAAESWIGEGSGSTSSGAILTISSTLTGSSTLHLGAAAQDGKIAFTGNLAGFSGTIDIGNSSFSPTRNLTVSFNNADLSGATLKMGFYTSVDILELSGSVSMSALDFNGTTLSDGTYSVADLNARLGNGSQFTGLGSLTIGAIPEPSTYAALVGLAGLTAAGMGRRRRR